MSTPRRRWPAVHAVAACVATLLLVALGGCGSANHIHLGTPPAPTTTIDPNADGGQAGAILAAYRGSLADFNAVATTAPLDPNNPELANHMAGEELSGVVSALTKLAQAGELNSGSLRSLHAAINQYNGTQAVVVSCEKDDVAVIKSSGRQLAPGGAASNTTELVNALVTLQDGAWKVTRSSQVSPGCS